MRLSTPYWLTNYCKEMLPQMFCHVDGRRILRIVENIVETDRWNSFDRFHDTTQTLVREYETAGAMSEVYTAQTGSQSGTGRWIIQEAADVVAARVDVIRPVRWRVLDYAKNPWHVAQWSTSTPADGMVNELVLVDSQEALDKIPRNGLAGKMVLTRMSLSNKARQLADKGAAGVIVHSSIKDVPDATAWVKFGWGGIPIDDAAARLVGLVVSENIGRKLRQLVQKHGTVTLKTFVDIRRYVGSHDVVSGIVLGAGDPQDEVWVLAHSSEPGAADNASGVAVCIEIARIIERLVADGHLPRPKRSIRLLNGYECYGFFHYLENTTRLQPPLAGVCIDSVGLRPNLCRHRLEWHATIPMSAGFVDALGLGIIRAALLINNPGYRCVPVSFVSTSDTLIGDPKYGFPCPWLTTHCRGTPGIESYYHNSADTPKILDPSGLAVCAAAMAAYVYLLADADSEYVIKLASRETEHTLQQMKESTRKLTDAKAEFIRTRHHVSIERLKRWMWGGERSAILSHLADCERQVREATAKRVKPKTMTRKPSLRGARLLPRRKAPLSPTLENTPAHISERIKASGLPPWALFWADGLRNLADIAEMLSYELNKEVTLDQVATFFEAHAELGYVDLIKQRQMISRTRLIRDLKALGLKPGMDVMVHSSLSSLGHVIGGAQKVIDALLAVIGNKGTLVMPSFNHYAAEVFNPMTTPTNNGAIPDAMWRRPEAVRSIQTSHAVAAIGPNAEELCRGHIKIGTWEQDSPIGRLIHSGGYILTLGAMDEPRTAYHVAEDSVPCRCMDPFGTLCRIVAPDGSIRRVRGLAYRSGVCPVSPAKLNETLDQRKLQRHGMVGHAPATLVKAKKLWEMRREHLAYACPACKIKPKAHTWPKRR